MICTGDGVAGTHCCWVGGEPCGFLRENVAGRRFACGLRLEHDSWDGVITDPRYRRVGKHWISVGQPFEYCQTFDPALCCRKGD